ncbi:probable cysteine protease RD21B [Glycine max]|uniref:probable cysteine protease RD21B n=1 Tax=Glycine max TaxID=3847 RepID=UPI000233B6E3|nr:probable cysteine protease RD21B [Glycine max]
MNMAIVLLFMVFAVSSALDMSIISHDNAHADRATRRTDDEVMSMFEEWLVKHDKVYNALGEKEKRFQIFKNNLRFIDERNSLNRTYKLGLNVFADLTNAEYRAMYLRTWDDGPRLDLDTPPRNHYVPRVGDTIPKSVDWRKEGAVTPVKNQGATCNSCWAFTAVGAVESLVKIKTGDLISLSEQEVVDCTTSSSRGCGGGDIQHGYIYIRKNGISLEKDYPYRGDEGKCDSNKKNAIVTIDGHGWVPTQLEEALNRALFCYCAYFLYVDKFFLCQGVFKGKCGTELNHALLLVGYGTEKDGDYWIAKNSYSDKWGENGYIRIQRKLSTCKFGNGGYYPIIKVTDQQATKYV